MRSSRARGVGLFLVVGLCFAMPSTSTFGDPPAAAPAANDLYGDQGGATIAPADDKGPNAIMRARKDDTFFQLSNPREGMTSGDGPKRKALLVDFEVTSRGTFDGGMLVVLTEDGGRSEVSMSFAEKRDRGTIELVTFRRIGGFATSKGASALPKNAEMFVTRGDDRYRPPSRFMVSNSLIMGTMKGTARPRDWTPAEIKLYTQPPPNYLSPNVHPTVGIDVPALPDGGGKQRFVEPEGRLLGLDFGMGEWDGQKCVGALTPVFSVDQPPSHAARVVARKGFAVAGAEVNQGKYLHGIRLLFRRVKPDGTFDTLGAYKSDWIGIPATGKLEPLANDGKRVMGFHIQRGAIVDRFSLVVEN